MVELKQQVIRKTLTGNWEPFTFEVKSKSFYVKNFSENICYISFKDNDTENESIRVNGGMGEIVYISQLYNLAATTFVYTIYVKGTGEIEVEAIEWQP